MNREQAINYLRSSGFSEEQINTVVDALSEPKTGKWITEDMFDGDVAYRCSECNELFWIASGTPKDNEYNFCPKCGAKMGGKE